MRIGMLILATMALLVQGGACKAIEPLKVFRGALVIEGTIEQGDYEKLRTFLANRNAFNKIRRGVFLASPGGRVTESIRMGYLIRALNLRTLLPSLPAERGAGLIQANDLKHPGNYLCASACFFLYIAGIDRNPLHVGRLGIHRPFVKSRFNLPLSEKTKTAAVHSIEEVVSSYVLRMNVSEGLLTRMFAVPSNSVHWLNDDEFSKFVRWTSPQFKTDIQRQCPKEIGAEKNAEEFVACREKVAADLAAQGWKETFDTRFEP
jgi:hypothetical protein